jgi:Xaa-Pro dipeptidase
MRTVFVGEVPGDLQKLADASLASLEAVLANLGAGVPAREVAKAGAALLPLDDPTIGFHQTYGYSIGLGLPPTWSDDPSFKINMASDLDLQAGMVLHVTMGLRRIGKYGAVCSETVAITGDGCEVLTSFPRQYFYK